MLSGALMPLVYVKLFTENHFYIYYLDKLDLTSFTPIFYLLFNSFNYKEKGYFTTHDICEDELAAIRPSPKISSNIQCDKKQSYTKERDSICSTTATSRSTKKKTYKGVAFGHHKLLSEEWKQSHSNPTITKEESYSEASFWPLCATYWRKYD